MKRSDVVVISVSAVLAVIVAGAVAFSHFVLDKEPSRAERRASESDSSLLVLTWGPTLCAEEGDSNPGCKSGHVGGPSLVLHGLWPQPRSEQLCGVSHTVSDKIKNIDDPQDMPEVPLPPDLQAKLKSMMSDSSVMTAHEWFTHGTCSGVTPTEYFGLATSFFAQAAKVLNPVFQGSQGARLSPSTVRQALDSAFGEGAGQRAGLTCREHGGEGFVIYEIQMSLPPVPEMRTAADTSLGQWLTQGPQIPAGCQDGHLP